jgi:molybdenum cofactor biosynthesis enzyme MoaA
MEFELSNRCNLQCIQCTGELSSSIRAHREHRPPLPAAYDDRFFDDLAAFIPHLRHASFAGGEPFLGPENFRVFDLIERLNPDLRITVCTNGTVRSERVERLFRSLRMDIIVSIDGATRATYEAVRHGASFDRVMENVAWFASETRAAGRSFGINFCLMPQTVRDLPAMLRLGDELGVAVNVLPVRGPAACSLAQLPDADLRDVLAELEAADPTLRAELRDNAAVWDRELARLRAQVAALDDGGPPSSHVLMFPRDGGGAVDLGAERERLATPLGGGPVPEAVIGRADRIVRCDAAFAAAFDLEVDELVGATLERLLDRIDRFDDLPRDDAVERAEFEVQRGAARRRLVLVPARGRDGRADEVVALLGPAELR